jgi:hypothetical protein
MGHVSYLYKLILLLLQFVSYITELLGLQKSFFFGGWRVGGGCLSEKFRSSRFDRALETLVCGIHFFPVFSHIVYTESSLFAGVRFQDPLLPRKAKTRE